MLYYQINLCISTCQDTLAFNVSNKFIIKEKCICTFLWSNSKIGEAHAYAPINLLILVGRYLDSGLIHQPSNLNCQFTTMRISIPLQLLIP